MRNSRRRTHRGRPLPGRLRNRIEALIGAGEPVRNVAKVLRVSPTTVQKYSPFAGASLSQLVCNAAG
ncbi:MAG: hypothetical protein AB7U73_01870 [Pirellulales bacterium]